MITKDKKVMCDSCHKEIKGEANTIANHGRGWARYAKKFNHFHPTPYDCANAIEVVKIYMSRGMNKREDNNG